MVLRSSRLDDRICDGANTSSLGKSVCEALFILLRIDWHIHGARSTIISHLPLRRKWIWYLSWSIFLIASNWATFSIIFILWRQILSSLFDVVRIGYLSKSGFSISINCLYQQSHVGHIVRLVSCWLLFIMNIHIL
mgnify:FL=1